ncbi:MAG TPA: diacylglycerol kinase family protein [Polyangiaceae bacterium]|nr:diacylglycerol kinase family protein [Polyangiaceae bacterium]
MTPDGAPVSRWPAPSAQGAAGAGLAVLVNANAKRGGRRVAVQIARALPGASVRLTKSTAEIDAWLRVLPRLRGFMAAGGDGSAVALVNALARITPPDEPLPPMGILPLGTGNGWAHALGAPKLHFCLDRLASKGDALPTRRCGLVEVEGTLAQFAGTGWDAMILDDYKKQLESSRGPGRRFSKSVYGYVTAALLRTTPRVAWHGNPRVVIENLGDEVYEAGPGGCPRKMVGTGRGAILYEGPFGTASVGTCPEFGYRFKAFPLAERMPGYINVRAYDRGALRAVTAIPRLWSGKHPLPGMHDWWATRVRMTFSRPVPLQIGGDAHGMRRSIDYAAAQRSVRMVDWRRMG